MSAGDIEIMDEMVEAAAKVADPKGEEPNLVTSDICDWTDWQTSERIAAAIRSMDV